MMGRSYEEKLRSVGEPSRIEKLEGVAENLRRIIEVNERSIEYRRVALEEMRENLRNVELQIQMLKGGQKKKEEKNKN